MYTHPRAYQFSFSGNASLSTEDINTRDNYTTTVGYNAGKNVATVQNIIIGYQAGQIAKYVYDTVAIGFEAAGNTTGNSRNVLIGSRAGYELTGANNLLIGYAIGTTLTGSYGNIILSGDGTSVLNSITDI
jgi:hypothetical protein